MMVRRVCRRSITALTAMILVVLLFAMGTRAQDRNPPARQFPDIQLPFPARGGEALSALAPYLPQLAASYGKSEDELRNIFLRDHTLWTDTRGRLFYGCEFGPPPVNAPGAENAGAVLEAPFPDDQTFLLHSRPSATKVIYLDFDGQTTSGTAWSGGGTIVSAPFDLDGIPSSFNTTERERIQYIWQRVAEDYAPFDVDVTTEDPGEAGLRRTTSSDVHYGVRVVISPTNWYGGGGGVAYVGVFNEISSTDVYGTCWVFTQQLGPNGEKYIAEAASHEAGHTLGLNHDGLTDGTEYYSGHGNWAPIMGSGYDREVTQWSKGEYAGANNTEDDLAIIPTYGAPLRADDHGNFIGTATALAGTSISASGIIETRNDVDMFSFQSGAGSISFTVNPAPRSPNLNIYAALYDGTGNLVASNDGAGLPASLTATVTAGTYYLAIDGVGSGDPATTGYSDYDSLGQYQITGTVIDPGTKKNPVANASASPAIGTAPLAVNFSSAGSSDSDGTIQTYHWDFNDGSSSSSANPAHTYNAAGVYIATLVVTDNDGLSSSDTVTITVANATPTAPTAPANVKATAVSTTQVNLTWTASTSPIGISRYEIERSYNHGSYSLVGTSTTASFANSSVSPGITYLYRVRAVDTHNVFSGYSNLDLATTILFTDDPLVSGLTKVRAVQFSEMRQAVNAVRKSAGLAAATWTDTNLAGMLTKAIHIQEMRNYLSPALAALGFSAPSYTDPALTTGVTRIRKVHLEELRQRVI